MGGGATFGRTDCDLGKHSAPNYDGCNDGSNNNNKRSLTPKMVMMVVIVTILVLTNLLAMPHFSYTFTTVLRSI